VSKPATAVDYLAKAERALSGARALLAVGDTEGSCSRAYCAMFDAAQAALIMEGHGSASAVIKTHNGLLTIFSKEFTKTGRIALDVGKSLDQVHQLRVTADYSGGPPSPADAAWAVQRAEEFLRAVAAMVSTI